jgi:hypothetical protein
VRYDHATGFFSAKVMTLAMRGLEGLIHTKDYLEIKLALPCSAERKAIPAQGIFHEKAGVIEDKAGNRLAFNGSVNETAKGWRGNWESFHVFTDWGGTKIYVDDEETGFAKLWANQAKRLFSNLKSLYIFAEKVAGVALPNFPGSFLELKFSFLQQALIILNLLRVTSVSYLPILGIDCIKIALTLDRLTKRRLQYCGGEPLR